MHILLEAAADVRNMCTRIQREENANTVNDDDVLAGVIIQSRKTNERGGACQRTFQFFEMFHSRFMRYDNQQKVVHILLQRQERGNQHLFIFGPAAARNNHAFVPEYAFRDDVALASLDAPIAHLVVPRVANGFNARTIQFEDAKCLHVVLRDGQDVGDCIVHMMMETPDKGKTPLRIVPHGGIGDQHGNVSFLQFPDMIRPHVIANNHCNVRARQVEKAPCVRDRIERNIADHIGKGILFRMLIPRWRKERNDDPDVIVLSFQLRDDRLRLFKLPHR